MGIVILIVVIVSTVWVGIDASGRDFSNARGAGPRTTAGWVAGALVLWILFFPWYLIARSRASTAVPTDPPAASGWYSDPTGSARLRWWNGSRWTQDTAD